MPLKQWEAMKAQDTAKLLEKLQQDPDDRQTILEALGLSMGYQDEALFDKLATSLAEHRRDDAAIQTQLGAAYAYFARFAEAETAYRAALAAEDKPEVRQQLALALLKQSRPEDAAPYLEHILVDKTADNAGFIYLLVEGYQAQGMHEQALALMDRRDEVFPQFAALKDYQNQRKASQRYLHSGKRIPSAFLGESRRAGYQEGSWRSRIPYIIAPLLILGGLCWYLGAAFWAGQARKVYVVNGWQKAYTVAINGREQILQPGVATLVEIPEGEVTVESRSPEVPLAAMQCRIETSFWSRPFLHRTFVLNPDRLAILIWEEVEYAEHPVANQDKGHFHVDQECYTFENIDYEFKEFPGSLTVKKGQTLKKRRVALLPSLTPQLRLSVAMQMLNKEEQIAFLERWLLLDPNDYLPLFALLQLLEPDKSLAFLETKLSARPVLVEFHRAYQTLMNKQHPDVDLRPRYREMVKETNAHPDVLYLLARLEDDNPAESEKLLKQAVAGPSPAVYAMHSLGYHALEQGQFADALRWAEKAAQAAPNNFTVTSSYHKALLANRQYDRLLQELQKNAQALGEGYFAVEQVGILAAKGDKAAARGIIQATAQRFAGPRNPALGEALRAQMEARQCIVTNDVAGFLKWAGQIDGMSPFELNLLRGKFREAAKLVNQDPEKAYVQHGLLYLAANKAGDKKLAEEQWQALLANLEKGSRPLRGLRGMLGAAKPLDTQQLQRMAIDPEQKRVLLAVVARRYPETAKDLLPLAKKLNFFQDETALCLRRVLD
jgi:Flp pilus assembly protein TadD